MMCREATPCSLIAFSCGEDVNEEIKLNALLQRNKGIPALARNAALYVIGIRCGKNRPIDGMGALTNIPKAVVRMIGRMVWETRGESCWIPLAEAHQYSKRK